MEINKREADGEAGFSDYGHLKHFNIDIGEWNRKKVLITGAGSYIGESFERWAEERYPVNFTIDTLDMQNPNWREKDFSPYDIIFHVAGIAHADVGKVLEEEKKKYYAVNTDLAIETAEKAKREGVRQFVLMSSMIVYGDSAPFGKEKVIDEHTVPSPANFYGDSKWQADKGIRKLADETFHVAVLRPPMIYGKGSKGNYPVLADLARKLPIFPDVENRRSMLYIGNLCEFLCKLMLSGEGGVYFPQNGEYTRTSEMVRQIAEVAGKKVWVTKLLNPAVAVGSCVPGRISGLVDKAFGSCIYEQKLSKYNHFDYQVHTLWQSVALTEGAPVPRANRLFTIITVCRNSENVIEKTIMSVLRQTYDYIEYIILDGTSKDRTVSVAERYRDVFGRRGYRYTVVSEPDSGIYDAMNKGIRRASGELIGFINAGDWYEEDAVGTAAGAYEEEPFDYFYADINLIRRDGTVLVKHSRHDRVATSRHWNHPSSFATRDVYERLGLFKCRGIHDDFEFFLRVRKSGAKIKIVNKVLANFVLGGISNKRSLEKSRERVRDRYMAYRENGYSPLYKIECIWIEAVKFMMA